MNPVCDVDVDVYVVAEGPQDREADVVSSVRERSSVWYWHDWLRRRPCMLLVGGSLMFTYIAKLIDYT